MSYNSDYKTYNQVFKNATNNVSWQQSTGSSPSDPTVWGPAFWYSIHNGAATYPIKASPICIERMVGFILGLPYILPCESCAEHATAHIEKNRDKLHIICSTRENLFNFFVDFHNYVNMRFGKNLMSYEKAYNLYTKPVIYEKLRYNDS